jgi:chaperonin GroES
MSSTKNSLPNLGKIGDAHLDRVPALSDCNPGLQPTEYNVIIAPAQMVEKIGSILLPDSERERLGMALQVGRIVAVSPVAFNYERWPSEDDKPQVGQLAWFARFAGGIFEGVDGKEYRIVKDKDIGAIIIEQKGSSAA